MREVLLGGLSRPERNGHGPDEHTTVGDIVALARSVLAYLAADFAVASFVGVEQRVSAEVDEEGGGNNQEPKLEEERAQNGYIGRLSHRAGSRIHRARKWRRHGVGRAVSGDVIL